MHDNHHFCVWMQYATETTESNLMTPHHTEDKQLQGIALEAVLEKRRLDQALNAKEFAVCAGVSYSTARAWVQLPGFPVFQGVIFWQDFVQWRADQLGLGKPPVTASDLSTILDESGS